MNDSLRKRFAALVSDLATNGSASIPDGDKPFVDGASPHDPIVIFTALAKASDSDTRELNDFMIGTASENARSLVPGRGMVTLSMEDAPIRHCVVRVIDLRFVDSVGSETVVGRDLRRDLSSRPERHFTGNGQSATSWSCANQSSTPFA